MKENLPEGHFLFTSESVSEGHPDKMCDQVSDAVLDACLKDDPLSHVACETCTKTGMVMVFGEITTDSKVDQEKIVRDVCKEIGQDDEKKGLDQKTMKVMVQIEEQSSEISSAVSKGDRKVSDADIKAQLDKLGAGDQGIMFGYATDETPELFPLTIKLAHDLLEGLSKKRKSGEMDWLRPDSKSQITIEQRTRDNGSVEPLRIHTVLISHQHREDQTNKEIEPILTEQCKSVLPKEFLDERTKQIINPSGSFTIGGPQGDAGLTGRKIIVDTYGGWGAHGGGAFSGKDPSKVDRSAAQAARWVAKSLVAQGLCRRVLVQLSQGIGIAEPLSIFVNSQGTVKDGLKDSDLSKIIDINFDLRPGAIIKDLEMLKPKYQESARQGHFGRNRPEFLWEQPKPLLLK